MVEFVTESEQMTRELGAALAKTLPGGTVIALAGDLGCGKTVISRGFARGLGITEAVTSPTFTIAQEYACPDGKYLYHLDMYRITDENAALAFGIDEFLFAPNAITLVEWPDRIAGLIDDARLKTIRFEHDGESQRRLSFVNWNDEDLKAIFATLK